MGGWVGTLIRPFLLLKNISSCLSDLAEPDIRCDPGVNINL